MFQSDSWIWSHWGNLKNVLHILGFKKVHNIMKKFDKVNRREIIINIGNVFWSTNWNK